MLYAPHQDFQQQIDNKSIESVFYPATSCVRTIPAMATALAEIRGIKRKEDDMNGTAKGYGAGHIDISVLQCDWGDASRMDIQRLLQDTASHISREVRSAFYGRIEVVRFPGSKNPMTRFRVSAKDPFCIELSVRDRKWNQYAYQFAHEFCHVLSGYENLRDNPNNWFHESICELASLFTLRKMADRWLAAAPYPNWADYSPHLKNYAFNIIAHTKEYAPAGFRIHKLADVRKKRNLGTMPDFGRRMR